MAGTVYAVEVRNGIDGTVVANPNFSGQKPGATSFTDTAGRPWTLNGSALITALAPGPWFRIDQSVIGGTDAIPF